MTDATERSLEPLDEGDLIRLREIGLVLTASRCSRTAPTGRGTAIVFLRSPFARAARCTTSTGRMASRTSTSGRSSPRCLDRYPDRALYRRNKAHDYGPSRLGRHPDLPGYAGRKVDLLSDSIPVSPDADPIEAIRHWLRVERRGGIRRTSRKKPSCSSSPYWGTWSGPSSRSLGFQAARGRRSYRMSTRDLSERLEQPAALLSRTDLRDLGRRAVDAVFRALPVVVLSRIQPAADPRRGLRGICRDAHVCRRSRPTALSVRAAKATAGATAPSTA